MSNLQGNWNTKNFGHNTSGNKDNVTDAEGNNDTVEERERD